MPDTAPREEVRTVYVRGALPLGAALVSFALAGCSAAKRCHTPPAAPRDEAEDEGLKDAG